MKRSLLFGSFPPFDSKLEFTVLPMAPRLPLQGVECALPGRTRFSAYCLPAWLHGSYVKLALAAVPLLAVLLLALLLPGCSPTPVAAPAESLTIGAPTGLENSLPLLVAQEQGFFVRNGLAVTLRKYDSGLAAMNGLLAGEVDVAGPMAEYVLVGKSLAGAPVQALATIDRIEFNSLTARKDHGIETPADLKGKRVAVLKGTAVEFYLGRFLALNGIDASSVTLVDTGTMGGGVDRLLRGEVDALAATEPYPSQAAAQLGDKGVWWSVQSSQPVYSVLTGRRAWIAGHRAAVERLLRSLDDAEDFIAGNPEATKRIAREKFGLTDEGLATMWPRNRFSLSLEMALIVAMEDEARWMIQNRLTDAKQVPDFGQYVYPDALQAVKPDAVRLIR
ncbi:MAG: ABC transporter substrate-binding protein [Nitrososphaerales archaeon]